VVRIVRVLAPNPGPYTLEGTNTWVVGADPAVVIDPGPPDEGHVREVARTAGNVHSILLTHHHPDHAPGAASLASLTGAPVLALVPAMGERPLTPGQPIVAGKLRLEAVATPGHTPDHAVFFDRADRVMFTGDAVLGRGTSVIDPPDGDVGAYLDSLRRLIMLDPAIIYPGHGPAVWSAKETLGEYLEHRERRERQVLEALVGGAKTPTQLVPEIYARYPASLFPAAARSVLAHLLKLEREGTVTRVGGAGGEDAFLLVGEERPGGSSVGGNPDRDAGGTGEGPSRIA
jgi:glyoxylase-like metal-dependent hydrolase (beta-lactamase superfamily II)